jgi:ABC-type uncharacterized transport system substrate-binding protein
MLDMNRREFITLLGGTAAASPLAARAQQPAMPVIGFLSSASRNHDDVFRLAPFRQGLSEAGYTEGRNVAIEYRGADYQLDRLPALAADLTRRKVSLIAAGGSPASALAAKSATATIPIVFTNAADPVRIGLVASLNRPGGNVTGFTQLGAELGAKRLGLLRELVPAATSIGVLVNPNRPGVDAQSAQAQEAARTLGLQPHILKASSERDFDAAFLTLVQLRASALVIAHTKAEIGVIVASVEQRAIARYQLLFSSQVDARPISSMYKNIPSAPASTTDFFWSFESARSRARPLRRTTSGSFRSHRKIGHRLVQDHTLD